MLRYKLNYKTMKKNLLSFLAFAILTFTSYSQENSIDYSNVRDGETVEYCTQHKRQNEYLLAHPEAAQQLKDLELGNQNENSTFGQKATILYIPVVFHVLHNGGVENISDEQIIDAVSVLNRDFAKLNTDANNVVSAFQGVPANSDIQFRLATIAPDGTCFSGITRTQSPLAFDGSSGGNQVNAIKNGNDIYQGEWAGNKYLNFFVVAEAGGAAGYTYNPIPGFSSMGNGIWILNTYTGSIGTSSVHSSRSLTHEVGHWLNLSHPWGPNNNPGNASSCGSDDGVQDTPTCIGLTACNLTANSCDEDNNYWGFDQIDNTENYMDYSYCSKMYTPGQVTRMRNALQSNTGGRNNVMSAGNLIATGADGNPYLCKADFSVNRTSICSGDQIVFTDESYNAVNGWVWTFTGGTPSSSSDQNPTITYNTPGLYQVKLVATDGTNNDDEIKVSYIRVLPSSSTIPLLEGFESYSTLNNIPEWQVVNDEGIGFEIGSTGLNSSKSAKIMNFTQGSGSKDELISSPIDLSNVSGSMTLSFRYAHKRKSSNDDDWLKVLISNSCGENFVLRKSLHGVSLSTAVSSSSFVPSTESDWKTIHMTNVTSSYWVDNFRFKFQFTAGGGNNMYIDNINIYEGTPSDDLVAGITENELIQNLVLYPNPTDDELNVQFSLESSQEVIVQIQDLSGKVLQNNLINANTGTNLVFMNTSELSSGMYFMKINIGGAQKTIQFVIK